MLLGSVTVLATGCTARQDHGQTQLETAGHDRGRFLTVDGQRLHVSMQGEGPAVVFIHGNPGTWLELDRFVVPAFAGYRTITWDRPGYGLSERISEAQADPAVQAVLLHKLLGQLGIDRPVLVGHSYGCSVALAYAAAHPDAVRGLVLAAPLYAPSGRSDLFHRWPALVDLTLTLVPPPVAASLTEQMLAAAFAPEAMPQGFWTTVKPLWLQPSQLRASLQDTGRFGGALADLQSRYGSLSLPIALLAGGSDGSAAPADHARPLAAALPRAGLTVLPGAGHQFLYTRPERVRAAVDGLYDGHLN